MYLACNDPTLYDPTCMYLACIDPTLHDPTCMYLACILHGRCSTFSEYTVVPEIACAKIDKRADLETVLHAL